MAIAFRAESHTWTSAVSSTAWTLNKPSGTQAGDFLLGAYQTSGLQASVTPPSGWTAIRSVILDSVDSDIAMNFCYRIAQAEDGSSWTDGTQGTAAGRRLSVTLAYSGVDKVFPFVAENGTSTDTDGTTIATPSVTNDDIRAWRVTIFGAFRADGTDFTWTSDDTVERAENNFANATFEPAIQAGDSNGPVAAGSHSQTGTVTQAFDSAIAWIGIMRPEVPYCVNINQAVNRASYW